MTESRKLEIIVRGFLEGDSQPYRILLTKVTQYVYHQCSGSSLEKDDLISETLEILLDNLRHDRFRGSTLKELNKYIYHIIRNRLSRVYREREKLTFTDELPEHADTGAPTPEEETANKELADRIYRALDEDCRKLLQLKYFEQWTDQEIADHIGKSKNATSTALTRCKDKARNLDVVRDVL